MPAGLIHHERVRRYLPADHGLAEAPRRADDGPVAVAGYGVRGEQDPGGVGLHHLLHDDRQADEGGVYALVLSVRHRPRRPEARPAILDCFEYGFFTDDVQVRLLLAGEARTGQVFGGRRGTNGDGCVADFVECLVCGTDTCRHFLRHLRPVEKRADLLLRRLERRRAVGPRREADDLLTESTLLDEGVVGPGGDDEAGRHGEPRADQLAQVGALAAGESYVVFAYLVQPDRIRHVPLPLPLVEELTGGRRTTNCRGP